MLHQCNNEKITVRTFCRVVTTALCVDMNNPDLGRVHVNKQAILYMWIYCLYLY